MNRWKLSRRGIFTGLSGVLAFVFSRSRAIAAIRTPSAAEGPFYPDMAMRFDDADNDLVKIEGVVEQAGGEVVFLSGRVLNTQGNPINNARVEIWQCDANGRYLHIGDRQAVERDAAFQGFGHVVTGEDGFYEFRTIKPVSYPGRTPHIHVKVLYNNTEFITQFYVTGEDANRRDFLYQRLAENQQAAVEMDFGDQGRGPEAKVDIVI